MEPWDSPRVEYKLTAFGEKFVHILNEIEKLNQEIEHGLIEHRRELGCIPISPIANCDPVITKIAAEPNTDRLDKLFQVHLGRSL